METDPSPLLKVLLSESDELLAAMTASLGALRAQPSEDVAVDRLIQCAHTFRGIAMVAGHPQISTFAGRLESALLRLRKQASPERGQALELVDQSIETLRQFVAMVAGKRSDGPQAVAGLAEKLDRVAAVAAAPRTSILVVDDSRTVLHFVERALSEAGFRIVTARTEEAALEKLSGESPALVLLDLSLGEQGGTAFLERLASSGVLGRTRVVLFSNRPGEELQQMAERFGAAGVLPKTGNPRELVSSVREWLARSSRGPEER
jgi:two-component system, chemotaxis family, chemotaxis protein CheY